MLWHPAARGIGGYAFCSFNYPSYCYVIQQCLEHARVICFAYKCEWAHVSARSRQYLGFPTTRAPQSPLYRPIFLAKAKRGRNHTWTYVEWVLHILNYKLILFMRISPMYRN